MYTFKNTTVVIQGPTYIYTKHFAEKYQEQFEHVIVSTWPHEFKPVPGEIINPMPDGPTGEGNINLHIISTRTGLTQVKTKYAIKVRTDILILEPERWLEFCSKYDKPDRVFVLGLSHANPYSPRDQIFIGRTVELCKLFGLPHDRPDGIPSIGYQLYPELYLGLNYHALYDPQAALCVNDPEEYLYFTGARRAETLMHWERTKGKYMLPVSRTLPYHWPKYFPRGYDYNNPGEFWFEEIEGRDYI